jgi:endoglucanase
MNEPNAVTPTQWLASANAAIAAIRGAGATTQQILVPGTDWDGADTWVSSGNAQVLGSGIVDPSHNFAFEVHQYLDTGGSGTSSTVVSTAIGVERLTAITQWAEATGNKLFLGEFGVASDPTSLTALNNMLGYMAQHTDVWEGGTYWAGGPWARQLHVLRRADKWRRQAANGSARPVCADDNRIQWIHEPY